MMSERFSEYKRMNEKGWARMSNFEERMKELNEMISSSSNIVFFGGAGVSTESGIPDFRSKDGLYNQKDVKFNKYEPEYLLSHDCLYYEPKVFFEFYRQKMDCRGIKPNVTHEKLAALEKSGRLSAVITQNIDCLHQMAGSRNVLEIHGTTGRAYCTKCKKEYFGNFLFEAEGKIPRCTSCGGMVRPSVVLYGEFLPDGVWKKAKEALSRADMVIVGGTSLSVYPANTIMQYYEGDKDKMVIINRDETVYDEHMQLVFHESLGEVFTGVCV